MVAFMKVNGKMDSNQVRVHFMEVMVEYILGPGKIISFTAKVNSLGQMVKYTSANIQKM